MMGGDCGMKNEVESDKEKIEEIVNKIQWVIEYVDVVGEEHKSKYIDGLEWAIKELMQMI